VGKDILFHIIKNLLVCQGASNEVFRVNKKPGPIKKLKILNLRSCHTFKKFKNKNFQVIMCSSFWRLRSSKKNIYSNAQ